MKFNLKEQRDKAVKFVIFLFVLGLISLIILAYQQRMAKGSYINSVKAAAFEGDSNFTASVDEKMQVLQNITHSQETLDFINNQHTKANTKKGNSNISDHSNSNKAQSVIDDIVISEDVKNFVLGDSNLRDETAFYSNSTKAKPSSTIRSYKTKSDAIATKDFNTNVGSQLAQQRQADFIKAISSNMNVDLKFNHVKANKTQTTTATSNTSSLNNKDSYSQYNNLKQSNYRNDNQVEDVDTPYLLRQGTIIPAILLSSINSDIAGQVIAQVTKDVLDSPYGYYVLIPKGSKLIGQYQTNLAMGQERLMLAFNRIIFPDSKALDLGVQIATDIDGMSGLSANVDNHFFRILKNSLLLAAVSIGTNRINDTDNDSLAYEYGQYNSNIMSNKINESLSRNINVSPTLKLQSGYLFNVTLIQDFRFKGEYQSYDYEYKFN